MTRKKINPTGWRAVLDDFLQKFEIDSKEDGRTVLKPWGTQTFLLDELSAGMDGGTRFFIIGKGRQYGVTTILIPVDVMWALMHPGIEGAIIANTPKVAEVCRAQINDMQTRLPESHRVPLTGNSKDKMEWTFRDGTKSTIHLLIAGTTDRKTDLAKGHGLTFIHGTEVGEWGSETAFNSLVASLAQRNPNRLYIFESTGEGSNNLFARLWRHSLDDPERRCIFIPWFTHDLYRLSRRSKLYRHYMKNPQPTDDELELIKSAKLWDYELGDDQLAWYRATTSRMTSIEDVRKNYPAVPEDMFQLGGSAFIPGKLIRSAKEDTQKKDFSCYRINAGSTVADMTITELEKGTDKVDGYVQGVDLRVWQKPMPRGVYCVGVQPTDEDDGLVSIQVIRCFSDSVEQVAEYSSRSCETYQLAWITAYLVGWYKNCWVNIDLTYGGRAMFREMMNLRNAVSLGVLGNGSGIFDAMIFYLYNRIDNVSGSSRTWNWEWNINTEADAFSDFKSSFTIKRLIAHSLPMLDEMSSLVSENNFVGGDDGCDDARCRAMCIAIRAWVDHVRLSLISEKRTREGELKRDVGSAPATFLENIVNSFISDQQHAIREQSETHWRH